MTREAGTAAFAPHAQGVALGVSLGALRRVAVPVVIPLMTALLGLSSPARAQVTIDLHALDALPAARLPPRHIAPRPARKPAKVEARTHAPATVAAKPPTATPASPAPAQVAIAPQAAAPPAVPPVAASLPSIAAAPPPPATMASLPAGPPPSAVQGSEPAAPAQSRTLLVRFAPDQSDLTPPETSALTGLAHATPHTDTTSFEVAAYAPAAGGDASFARRLSLARALAVRTALVAAGVPAASVYVRALGAPPASEAGEPNRAVVTVMGANGSPAAPEQAKR